MADERADRYAEARRRLRTGTHRDAMARLWEMAREGLAHRAAMGVRELSYETDLVPGVARAQLTATRHGVRIVLTGVDWGREAGEQAADAAQRQEYVLDEAWLLR